MARHHVHQPTRHRSDDPKAQRWVDGEATIRLDQPSDAQKAQWLSWVETHPEKFTQAVTKWRASNSGSIQRLTARAARQIDVAKNSHHAHEIPDIEAKLKKETRLELGGEHPSSVVNADWSHLEATAFEGVALTGVTLKNVHLKCADCVAKLHEAGANMVECLVGDAASPVTKLQHVPTPAELQKAALARENAKINAALRGR